MDPNGELRLAQSGFQQTLKVLQTVISSELSQEEQGDMVDSLRNVVENYIDSWERSQHNQRLLQEMKKTLSKQEVTDWPEDLEAEFKKLQRQNEGKLKIDVKSHQWMKDFEKLATSNNIEEETEADDDDLVVSSEVQTICPITRREMVRPVKNLACGHVYDREGIEALMSQNAATRCPVVGCRDQAIVKKINLQEDKATKRAIANKKN